MLFLGMVLSSKDYSSEKKKEFNEMITLNSELLTTIISDVLEMAKIESGTSQEKIEQINISELYEELKTKFTSYKKKLNKDHLDIDFKVDSNIISIFTDRSKLIQVFSNLIQNAIKFTDTGEIIFGNEIEDGLPLFFVADTGIGISEEDQKIIFDRFRQGENPLNKKYHGTGLGLAISKSLVGILGGQLWVQSNLRKGSTFYFTVSSKIEEKK